MGNQNAVDERDGFARVKRSNGQKLCTEAYGQWAHDPAIRKGDPYLEVRIPPVGGAGWSRLVLCQHCGRNAHPGLFEAHDLHARRRLVERIDSCTERNAETGCLEWTGARSYGGYGRVSAWGREHPAHRVAYELSVGPIPDGLFLDHLCRNRACVEPTHLEPVTNWENLRRGDTVVARNLAKTECPQGHPYDEANTAVRRGKRHCRTCDRNRAQLNRDRKKAA